MVAYTLVGCTGGKPDQAKLEPDQLKLELDPILVGDPELSIKNLRLVKPGKVTFEATAGSKTRYSSNILHYRIFDRNGSTLGRGNVRHEVFANGQTVTCEVADTGLEKNAARVVIGFAGNGVFSN
jgi:hypothetical protein